MPDAIMARGPQGDEVVYRYLPGDMYAEVIPGMLAVRNSGGKTILFGIGAPGQPCELDGLKLDWHAACVG